MGPYARPGICPAFFYALCQTFAQGQNIDMFVGMFLALAKSVPSLTYGQKLCKYVFHFDFCINYFRTQGERFRNGGILVIHRTVDSYRVTVRGTG